MTTWTEAATAKSRSELPRLQRALDAARAHLDDLRQRQEAVERAAAALDPDADPDLAVAVHVAAEVLPPLVAEAEAAVVAATSARREARSALLPAEESPWSPIRAARQSRDRGVLTNLVRTQGARGRPTPPRGYRFVVWSLGVASRRDSLASSVGSSPRGKEDGGACKSIDHFEALVLVRQAIDCLLHHESSRYGVLSNDGPSFGIVGPGRREKQRVLDIAILEPHEPAVRMRLGSPVRLFLRGWIQVFACRLPNCAAARLIVWL